MEYHGELLLKNFAMEVSLKEILKSIPREEKVSLKTACRLAQWLGDPS